ncbi:hypothetical protein ACFXD5_41160 [Streptomyces sp. NPDC059385]|uniref:hypothetical protein n=1 Tax=Streptomyces sp. NPDC059385 TaxID=3346817 RepID=UPI0036957B08
MVVHPPDAAGGRRVRVDGESLGRALGPGDLLEFLRRAGFDPDDVFDDGLLIEWRGGGPAVWSPDPARHRASTSSTTMEHGDAHLHAGRCKGVPGTGRVVRLPGCRGRRAVHLDPVPHR